MNRILFKFILIFSQYFLKSKGLFDKVRIISDTEVFLKHGDFLDIKCESIKPIVWKVFNEEFLNINFKTSELKKEEFEFYSNFSRILKLEAVNYRFVRHFYCMHATIEKEFEFKNRFKLRLSEYLGYIAKVYIFVDDPNNLLAYHIPNFEDKVVLYKDNNYEDYLPCKLSSYENDYKLFMEGNGKKYYLDDPEIDFDRKYGFKVKQSLPPKFGEVYPSLRYKCGIDDQADQSDFEVVSAPKIKLSVSPAHTVTVGDSFAITCNISMNMDFSFKPKLKYFLPNDNAAVKEGRVDPPQQSRPDWNSLKGTVSFEETMTIYDSELKDTGKYGCFLDFVTEDIFYGDATDIFVTEKKNPSYVEATFNTDLIQFVSEKDAFSEVSFLSSDEKYKIEWLFKNRTAIEANDKYKIDINKNVATLRIINFTENDQGTYLFEIKNTDSVSGQKFSLIKNDTDQIRLHDVHGIKNKNNNIMGSYFGKSFLNILNKFKFVPCTFSPKLHCEEDKEIHFRGDFVQLDKAMKLKPVLNITQMSEFQLEIQFSITLNESGIMNWGEYYSPYLGKMVDRRQNFIITEYDENFFFKNYRNAVTISIPDDFQLECIGTRDMYRSIELYEHKKRIENNSDYYQYVEDNTKLSKIVKLIYNLSNHEFSEFKIECRGELFNQTLIDKIFIFLKPYDWRPKKYWFHSPKIYLNIHQVAPLTNTTKKRGENLAVYCKSIRKIKWIVLKNSPEALELNSTVNEKDSYWTSVLKLHNISVEFVKFYYCVHSDIKNSEIIPTVLKTLEHQGRLDKIYLFVDDPDAFLLPAKSNILFFERTETDFVSLIDCRPAYQSLIVNLTFNYDTKEREHFTSDKALQFGYYDSKYGFFLEYSKLLLYVSKHPLFQVSCWLMDKIGELSFRFVQQMWNPNLLTYPTNNKYVMEGETLKLYCKYFRLYYVLPTSPPPINWIVPTKRKPIINEASEEIRILDDLPVEVFMSVMTIDQANSKSETGEYKCNCLAYNNLQFFELKTNIIVRDKPDIRFIDIENLTNDTSIIITPKEVINLNIQYFAYPDTKLKWLSPNNTEIKGNNHKYSTSFENYSHSLHIKNSNLYDTGIYTVIANNGFNKVGTQFIVDVRDEFAIHITDSYAMINKYMTSNLTLIGTRQPEILELVYTPCKLYQNNILDCNPKESTAFVLNFKNQWNNILKFKPSLEFIRTSYYNTTISFKYLPPDPVPGSLDWKIQSKFGVSEARIKVDVGDTSSPMEILDLEEIQKVKIGDELTLKCSAVKSRFKENINWYQNNSTIINKTEIINYRNDTKYSFRKYLKFYKIKKEHAGFYECRAYYINSPKYESKVVEIKIAPDGVHWWLYVLIGGLLFLICIVGIYLFIRFKKDYLFKNILKNIELEKFNKGAMEKINPNLPLDQQADLLPYDQSFEFPEENLQIGGFLNSGEFGDVYKAIAKNILPHEDETVVAVKIIKTRTDEEIIKCCKCELKIMIHMGKHLNILNLLGAVTKKIKYHELMIILEYCEFGSLNDYLKKNRINFVNLIDKKTDKIDTSNLLKELQNFKNKKVSVWRATNPLAQTHQPSQNLITTSHLICWSLQMANGMSYLASRNIVHGDLAARNLLLSGNNILKISDFGLAKSLYKKKYYVQKNKKIKVPVKWMAPECIIDSKYTSSTDVWSFGITLWEFFSLCAMPYPHIKFDYHDFITRLNDGYRMECPPYANQEIYKIMYDCWDSNPSSRPSFEELELRLSNLLNSKISDYFMEYNSYYERENSSNSKTNYFASCKSNECGKATSEAVKPDNRIKPLWENYEMAEI